MLASLALSALAFAGRTVSRSEAQVSDRARAGRSLDRLQARLGGLIAQNGPFLSGPDDPATMSGTKAAARFECGQPAPCQLALSDGEAVLVDAAGSSRFPLPRLTRLSLAYVSALDGAVADRWPSPRSDRLAALVLMSGGRPAAVFPSLVERRAGCAFELSQLDCVSPR